MAKIIIDNIYSKIVGHLPDEVNDELYDILSYKHADAQFIPSVKEKKWDGVFRLYYRNRGQQFYTGLYPFVREILDNYEIPYTKVDVRGRPAENLPNLKFIEPPNYEERAYQTVTVDRCYAFTRGVVEVATAGGKTTIMSRLIGEIKTAPFVFYVTTKDLLHQAYDNFSQTLNVPIGIIGDGMCDIKGINVCTIQTAVRSLHYADKKFKIDEYKFDDEDTWDDDNVVTNEERANMIKSMVVNAKGVVFDECHHTASKTVMDVMKASSSAYWRFGCSATPYRESGDEILIQSMFGSKVVEIKASHLIKHGYLIKPYIFFEPIDSKTSYSSFAKVYKACISCNEDFNNHVADTAKHLMDKGLSVLILVKQYNQGNYIKKLLPEIEFVTGKMSGKKRKQAIQDLRDKKKMGMIATSLADEGLDIPTLDVAILAGGGASATRVNQRIGRTIRKSNAGHKDKSIVIVYDHHKVKHLKDHTKKVRRILKGEPEFEIINSKGEKYILDEIDAVLGHGDGPVSLFDV